MGRFINNSFYKYYIQPSFGVTSTYIDAIVSIRIAQLNLYGINYWQINDPQNSQHSKELDHDYRTLLNAKQSYLYEPCVTMRVGWKYFKIQGQLSSSGFIKTALYNKTFNIEESNMNIGLYFTLSKKAKAGYNK